MTDDIVEHLRDRAWYIADEVRVNVAEERDLMGGAADEIERLRSWIDRQEPRAVYEATICPICHRATESKFWSTVEAHADGCPWRERTRRPEDGARD